MKRSKRIVLPLLVILIVLFQMAMPGIVHADEGAPPPTEEGEPPPTEEVTDPGSGEGEPPPEGELPPEGEPPVVAEILAEAPEGTQVAIINETGELEPLATQQAAEIIANSDPVWCPAGETPATDYDPGTPGNQNNCTPAQASITDLINYLASNPISGAGTIFFQEGDYGGPEPSIFIGASGLPDLTDLTLEGGWDLTNGSKVLDGTTTFLVPVQIDWAADISLVDIVIELDTYTYPVWPMPGLIVATSGGDIYLDNVEVWDTPDAPGAILDTANVQMDPVTGDFVPTGAGSVEVINSRFSNNGGDGLMITANGDVSLGSVIAQQNGGSGIYVDTCLLWWSAHCVGAGGVQVDDVYAIENGGAGFWIWANGDITFDSSYAGYNGDTGLYADTCNEFGSGGCMSSGDVFLDDSDFEENAGYGAYVRSAGDVTITMVYSGYNDDAGLVVDSAGDVDLTDVLLEGNGDSGLIVYSLGNVSLDTVESTDNTYGALIDTTSGTGWVDVWDSDFNHNLWDGLYVESHGDITLFGVWANQNAIHGAYLVTDGLGTITVNMSDFVSNGEYGLYAHSMDGDISLWRVNASANGIKGAYLEAGCTCVGSIFVEESTFFSNGEVGLWAVTQQGDITLTDVEADGGHLASLGAFLKSYDGGLIAVTDSVFTNNNDVGLEIVGTNDVALDNVTAQVSGSDGARILSGWTFACFGPQGINVTVTDGTYQANGGYGFYVAPGPLGSLNLAGTINFAANANGDYYLDLTNPCVPPPQPPQPPEPPQPPVPPLPVHVIEVPDTGGTPVEMDCVNFGATLLILPNGDEVRYGCPGRGMYLIHHLQQGDLPGPLATGPRFISALNVSVDQDGQPLIVEEEGGYFVVSFKIPEGMENEHFSILFWDPSANNGAGDWVELPRQQVGGAIPLHPGAQDGMLILRGVYREDGYVRVKVNFTGTFVLIAH